MNSQKAKRKYRYHFSIRVGGRRRGYDCHIEVQATSQKGAAIKVRNRIKTIPDVANVPAFHYSEIICGLPVLPSEGHDRRTYNSLKRPAALKTVNPIHPRLRS